MDQLEAVTEFPAKRFKLKWTVEDFSYDRRTSIVPEYNSQDFHFIYNGNRVKTMIRLSVPSSLVYALIYIKELKGSVQMKWEYFLYNSLGEKLAVAAEGTATSYQQGDWTKSSEFSRENLLGRIFHDGKLILVCDLIIISNDYNPELMSEPSISKLQSGIGNDFAKLRTDEEFSDMTISVRGEVFRVHKNILAARSPVFAAMFKHEMKEAKSGNVEIDDLKPEVFEQFLDFIYSGKADVEQHAWELLAAADKYHVEDLKAICEDVLGENLTHENCFKILVLGDRHSAKKLKETAMKYIVANSVEIDKNGLTQLEDKSLILELMTVLMNRK